MVIYPTLSRNGSGPRELVAAHISAMEALEVALTRLGACAPHGRDYIERDLAFHAATTDHEARVKKIEHVRAELEDLALHIRREAFPRRNAA